MALHDSNVYPTQGKLFQQFYFIITTKVIASIETNVFGQLLGHLLGFYTASSRKHVNTNSLIDWVKHIFKTG